jgi:hypothetical protein
MADLFYYMLPEQEAEEGVEPIPDSVRRQQIPLHLLSSKKRIEIIDRLRVLAANRNRRLTTDSDRIILSLIKTTTDQDVSQRQGFQMGRPDEIFPR